MSYVNHPVAPNMKQAIFARQVSVGLTSSSADRRSLPD